MSLRHRLASPYFPHSLVKRLVASRDTNAVSVLMYHEVLPDSMQLPFWHVVSESLFREQVTYLQQYFDVVSIASVVDQLRSTERGNASNRPAVAITFDDGYLGNYETAYPILEELGLPFTVYVATSAIEDARRYWYDDIAYSLLAGGAGRWTFSTSRGTLSYDPSSLSPARRWAAVNRFLSAAKLLPRDEQEDLARTIGDDIDGHPLQMMTPAQVGLLSESPLVTIGCHTHRHDLLDTVSADEARWSILRAQELLSTWSHATPTHFSYPNGNFNNTVVELVGSLGFRSAVTTVDRTAQPVDDILKIPRIGIGRFENMNVFRARIVGLMDERVSPG